jgi:hypothetical protein
MGFNSGFKGLIRRIMTIMLFFSSLPSAPTRIPTPHNWLKTDRKRSTVWYSSSVYPRYGWATHRLWLSETVQRNSIAPTQSRVASSRISVRYFAVCTLSLSVTVRNLTFLWNSFADPRRCTVSGVGPWMLVCSDWGLESRRGHGCLLRVLCVVRKRPLRRADHSSGSPTECSVYNFFPVGN